MVENSKSYDAGRQLGQLLRRGKESSDKTVAATKNVRDAIAKQSSVLTEFVKEVRDTARHDAGDKAEALALRKKEAKNSENEKNSEGGRFTKLISYFKKDAKESRTDFGKRLFGFFAKIALVGTAVVLFIKNWNNAIKPFFKGFYNRLKEKLTPVFDGIKEQLKVHYEAFDKRFEAKFGTSFSETLLGIKENLLEFTNFTKKIYNQLFGSNEETSNSDLVNPQNKKKKPLTAEELGITDPAAVARFNEKVGDRTKSEERLRKKEIAADAAARSRIFFNTLRLSQKDSFLNNHKSIKKALEKDQVYLGQVDRITQSRRKFIKEFVDDEELRDTIEALKSSGVSDEKTPGMEFMGSGIDKELSRRKANFSFLGQVEQSSRELGRTLMMVVDMFNAVLPYSEKITGTPNPVFDTVRYKEFKGYYNKDGTKVGLYDGTVPRIIPKTTLGLEAYIDNRIRGIPSRGERRALKGDVGLFRIENTSIGQIERFVDILKPPNGQATDGGGTSYVRNSEENFNSVTVLTSDVSSTDPDY
jgi:hypothetical protein